MYDIEIKLGSRAILSYQGWPDFMAIILKYQQTEQHQHVLRRGQCPGNDHWNPCTDIISGWRVNGPLNYNYNSSFLHLHISERKKILLPTQLRHALADFKYCVTFNTHGNTNRSVYPSPSTQSKMLTSRPTQMLAMVLHFLKMWVLLNQIMFVIVKSSNMLGRWFLTNNLFQFIDTYHSYQIFH